MPDRTRPLWADLPHGDEITALLDELRDLTDVEVRAMGATWRATWLATRLATPVAVWGAAWRAVRVAADGAGRGMVREAVRDTALGAGRGDVDAGAATRDTALALVVADLVGQYGLTRAHLDTLTGPARTVPRLAAIIDRALPTKEN